MYASAYNKLFWGMIILIFHINLGPISILPNFVGYMIIYSGLNTLSSQNEIYKRGKLPAAILVVLSLKDIWNNKNSNVFTGNFYNINVFMMIIGGIAVIIDIYLIYIICSGIYDSSRERNLESLMINSEDAWKFYLGISLIFLLCLPFSMNLPVNYNMAIIIISIIKGIAAICIIVILRKCRMYLGT